MRDACLIHRVCVCVCVWVRVCGCVSVCNLLVFLTFFTVCTFCFYISTFESHCMNKMAD